MSDRKIKVYFAILTKGWIRAEIPFFIMPDVRRMPDVEVLWRNPKRSWKTGVANNRNHIVHDFLQTDCDFLFMIDHDIVPLSNPLELVYADKDIVGFPAKIRQEGKLLNWSAYMKHPDIDAYAPIDFAQVDDTIDLLKLNESPNDGAVGTGAILIARRVLEAIKAPFTEGLDEFGRVEIGEDFAFCRRASKAGFEIYCAPKRKCEHFHEVGLTDILNYEDCDGYIYRRNRIDEKIIIGLGSGRSGSVSLATLLNFQKNIHATHEAFLLPWKFDVFQFLTYFPKLFIRQNYGRIPSDTASWYLPYIDEIMKRCPEAKFICLERDFELTAKSWHKKVRTTSHWTDEKSDHWNPAWDSNNLFRKCFPKYDLPKDEAIKFYIADYYAKAYEFERKYPHNFRIFPTEDLNSEEGVKRILSFAGVDESEMVIHVGVRRNEIKDDHYFYELAV